MTRSEGLDRWLTSRQHLPVFSQERLEYPPFTHPTGITPGFLKTLLNVFNFAENVCLKAMLEKWRGLALPDKTLFQLMLVGKLLDKKECDFYKFLAIACGFLGKVRRRRRRKDTYLYSITRNTRNRTSPSPPKLFHPLRLPSLSSRLKQDTFRNGR